jgi:membrane-bound ClpP family serine protease
MREQDDYGKPSKMTHNINNDGYYYEYIIIGSGWFLIILGIITILFGIFVIISHNGITAIILIILGLILFQIGRILKKSKYREFTEFKYTVKALLNRKQI